MKKMDYQNVKGTEDYLPEQETVRRKIRLTLENTFIRYGFKPLETPILNYTSLLSSKYGGGADILEEMYQLSDRGERDLSLRYDLTIPFAKVMAMNPTLRMPFKRYEIGKVFRDGPIKAGRLREFTQCDVDMVGVKTQVAEVELMMVATDVFNELGLDIKIEYNNRKILSGFLHEVGVKEDEVSDVILILDKVKKKTISEIVNELVDKNISEETIRSIREFITGGEEISLDFFAKINNELVKQGVEEIKELERFLTYMEIEKKTVFTPFLARGLEIYTGTIYEIFMNEGEIKSSIGSGGRYDNAIGGLAGSDAEVPTVGLSFGLDVIYKALGKSENNDKNRVDYYIIPLNTEKESLYLADKLRKDGFNVEVELVKKRLNKAFEKANKEGFTRVIVVGEEEVSKGLLKAKVMETGDEEELIFRFK